MQRSNICTNTAVPVRGNRVQSAERVLAQEIDDLKKNQAKFAGLNERLAQLKSSVTSLEDRFGAIQDFLDTLGSVVGDVS
jgi:phage-related protein